MLKIPELGVGHNDEFVHVKTIFFAVLYLKSLFVFKVLNLESNNKLSKRISLRKSISTLRTLSEFIEEF